MVGRCSWPHSDSLNCGGLYLSRKREYVIVSFMLVPLVTEQSSDPGPAGINTPSLPHLAATRQSCDCSFLCPGLALGAAGIARDALRRLQETGRRCLFLPLSAQTPFLPNSCWHQPGCRGQERSGHCLSAHSNPFLQGMGGKLCQELILLPYFNPFGWWCQGGPAA